MMQEATRKPVKKRRLALWIVCITAILAGALHGFLYYRAGALFRAFVEQMSDGTYSASSKTLRFTYFPLRIKATGVSFFPADTANMHNIYQIHADSIQLKLSSLLPLLLQNALEVKEVRLVHPTVLLNADGFNASRRSEAFHIPIQEIQNGLLKSLDLLQVDKCDIVNGGFVLNRTDVSEVFSVNHIHITIDSLLAARKGMLTNNGDTVTAHFTLLLDKPDIVIPDTNYLVDVDRLLMDTRSNVFKIDELRFSRKKERATYDTFQLSSVSMKGLNWDLFLDEGRVELDSVLVKNGLAQVDLTDRFLFQRRKDKKPATLSDVAVPLYLKYVSIDAVQYQLRSLRKTGPFTMLLDGDSLLLRNFRLLDATPRPVQIGGLSMNVKNFNDQDDNKTYRAGFERLGIRDNDLRISNYKLIPNKTAGFSANNLLEIPELVLYNYDLPALLEGRLEADRLELQQPTLVLDILQRKIAPGSAGDMYKFLNRLQPALDIDELDILNATIVLQPRNNAANSIRISQLNTRLNVDKLLAAEKIDDLMQVAERIQSDGFFISGPRFDLAVTKADLSKGSDALRIQRLRGNLANTLEVDLDSVVIKGKPGELIIPVDGFLNLEKVAIGSGAVMVLRENEPGLTRAAKSQTGGVNVFIDMLTTGPLQVTYFKNAGSLFAIQQIAMQVHMLQAGALKVGWEQAHISGKGLITTSGNSNFRIGGWQAVLPGAVHMQAVKVWPINQAANGVQIDIPAIELSNTIRDMAWKPDMLSNLLIVNPQVRWSLVDRQPANTRTAATKKLPLLMNHIRIIDPDMAGERITAAGLSRNISTERGQIDVYNTDIFATDSNRIAVQSFEAAFPRPVIEVTDNWTLQPADVWLRGRNFFWKKNEQPQAIIDTLKADGIGAIPLFKDSSHSLHIQSAGLAGWSLPVHTDSIYQLITRGPQWWVNGMHYTYRYPGGSLKIFNAHANSTGRLVRMDSLHLQQALPRDSFWASKAMQRDYINLNLGPTEMYNFLPSNASADQLHIDRIRTRNLALYAARNKTYPEDTIAYRPLLAQQLMQLPYHFSIDTLQVTDSRVAYHEVGDRFGREGYLYISELNGNVYGLQSRSASQYDSLYARLQGKFMGAGSMLLQYRQAYQDTLQRFRFDVGLRNWPLTSINPLVVPLNSIAFRRGLTDTMWLHAYGDKYRAYGFTGFQYSRMHINILKKGLDERYFMAGAVNAGANLLLLNNNPGKATPFYTTRLAHKATFNYWGRILSSALMGSLGVPGKKKKARKEMRTLDEALQIPTGLPD